MTTTAADAGAGEVAPPEAPTAARATRGECSSSTRYCSCKSCCAAAHPAAYAAFATAHRQCACGEAGACKNKCATTFCAGIEPEGGDPCAKCLDHATRCFESAQEACEADAACAPFMECMTESSCKTKKRCTKLGT